MYSTWWLIGQQAKEKLISSLQSGGGGTSGPAHEANLEQLRLEKEAIEVELETARLQGAGLREELQEAEERHDGELEQLTQQVKPYTTGGVNVTLDLLCECVTLCVLRRCVSWRAAWRQRGLCGGRLRRTCRGCLGRWRLAERLGRGRETHWLQQ